MKKQTSERWNATDIARVIYGSYKGLKARQIAFFVDRSLASIYQVNYFIKNPVSASKNLQKAIEKGQILEAKVRGGLADDQRRLWDAEIGRLRGVEYSYKKPQPEESNEKPEEEGIEFPDDAEVAVPRISDLITIRVDLDAIVEIIKAWKK